MKLRFWRQGDSVVADLDFQELQGDFYVATVAEGYGFAEGFRIVFCEEANPEPDGTVWVLSVIRTDECFSAATIEIFRARRAIARERSAIDCWWQA